MVKVTTERTQLTNASGRKVQKPQTQAGKKERETKIVQKTGPAMHGRSKLRNQEPPKSTFKSSSTDQDRETVRSYQTHDGAWAKPEMADKHPLSGPEKYLTVQDLGVLPEDGVQQVGMERPLPGKVTTICPVKSGEWTHHAD